MEETNYDRKHTVVAAPTVVVGGEKYEYGSSEPEDGEKLSPNEGVDAQDSELCDVETADVACPARRSHRSWALSTSRARTGCGITLSRP